MKAIQIKSRHDLPTEFSLEKYSPTSKFDIVDWVVNLELRVLSIFMLGLTRSESEDLAGRAITESKLRSAIFLDSPIRKYSKIEEFKNSPGFGKYVEASCITDFTAWDYFWHNKGDDRYVDFLGGMDEYIENMGKKPRDIEMENKLDAPYYKMMDESGVSHDGDLIVKVNLHGTDQKIIDDFTIWLKQARRRVNIYLPKRDFSNDDFSSWSKNSILPYLDLTIWAKTNNYEITQQLLGVTLFPDEYDVNLAERIRKVVVPMARNIAREEYVDAMRTQAKRELAEQKTSKVVPDKENLYFSTAQELADKFPP